MIKRSRKLATSLKSKAKKPGATRAKPRKIPTLAWPATRNCSVNVEDNYAAGISYCLLSQGVENITG